MALTNQQVADKINAVLPGAILHQEEPFGMLTLEISKDKIFELMQWFNNDNELSIHFLTLLGGVHYPDHKDRELGVVYHMQSMVNNFRMRLKVFMPSSQPRIKSITSIFETANWQERETFDFFGIIFDGHPNLKRILNDDEMDYHPMRKEYHLEDGTREDKDDRFFGR